MLIIVSGFAGSGKSSLADSLGKELKLKVVHASALLRQMSIEGVSALKNASPEKIQDWWESDEAKEFMKKRMEDESLDRALDKRLMEIAKKGNVILDSWTIGYLYKGKAFKIWLDASAETRAKRVSERDKLDFQKVVQKIKNRDSETKALYERLYNFRMGEKLDQFNLSLKTDNMSKKQVFEKVWKEIKKQK